MGIFSFFKKQKEEREKEPTSAPTLDKKLGKTRSRFRDNLLDFLLGDKPINADLLEELENQLIMADMGVEATARIMTALKK